jgi:glutaredoxin
LTLGLFSSIRNKVGKNNAPFGAHETTKEISMAPEVKVYALSTCIHCKNAKEYLDQCGVKYDCVHVDQLTGDERKATIEEIKKINPSVSFPTIVIDGKPLVGFNKDKVDEALGMK